MVRKAAGEYSKTKEEKLSQAAKAAFGWFSTCYGAFTHLLKLKFISLIMVGQSFHTILEILVIPAFSSLFFMTKWCEYCRLIIEKFLM